VLHQDLKPGNIMLDLERRRVRLTDFGLARFDRAEPGSTSSTVLGTPAYMAPEQARGYTGLLGPATEMYTVGVLIYELLSGQKPFSDRNDRAVMIKHCKAEPPPLRIRKGIDAPVGIRAVVERLLAKTPEERYPNAAALKQALLSLEANTAQPE
jgi:serine/threonine-protein kinase